MRGCGGFAACWVATECSHTQAVCRHRFGGGAANELIHSFQLHSSQAPSVSIGSFQLHNLYKQHSAQVPTQHCAFSVSEPCQNPRRPA